MLKLSRIGLAMACAALNFVAVAVPAHANAPCPSGWGTGGPIAAPEGDPECNQGQFVVVSRLVSLTGDDRLLRPIATMSYAVPAWCLADAKPRFTARVFDDAGSELWKADVSGEEGRLTVFAPIAAAGEYSYRVRLGNSGCHAESVIQVLATTRTK